MDNSKLKLKIALVTTTADAQNTIDFFIRYHLSIGIDMLYLYFDDPLDPAIAIAKKYQQVNVSIHDERLREEWFNTASFNNILKKPLIDSEVMVRQEMNVELALKKANYDGVDWLFHIDTDELIYPNGHDLNLFVLKCIKRKFNNITLLNYEAIPQCANHESVFEDITMFKKNNFNHGRIAHNPTQVKSNSCVTNSPEHFFLYYQNGKSLAKVNDIIGPDGVHFFNTGKTAMLASHADPLILHYHCGNFTSFLNKYQRLGDFSDNWQGGKRTGEFINNFHLEARDSVASNDHSLLKEFYNEKVVISDSDKINQLITNGIVVNISDVSTLAQDASSFIVDNSSATFDFYAQLETSMVNWMVKAGLTDDQQLIFQRRFELHGKKVCELFFELYDNHEDARYCISRVFEGYLSHYSERSLELKSIDEKRVLEPGWLSSNKVVAATCYLDLFCGDFEKLLTKVNYLVNLGITYLYLLPIFDVNHGANDGGFSIQDYKKINQTLGTMQQFEVATRTLRDAGITLCLDFVLNHTSSSHEWAVKAADGEAKYQDFYWFFNNELEVNEYLAHVTDTFPEQGRDITYNEHLRKWVWTTFNRYQWDLNFSNPNVFVEMLENMLFLANKGVDVFRADAIPHIWKEKGTSCKSLPECHKLLELFSRSLQMVAPGCQMKSEAIVAPESICDFSSTTKASLTYRPLLPALLWHSLSVADTQMLSFQLSRWSQNKAGCEWINYINSHDDLNWVFSNDSIKELYPNKNTDSIYSALLTFFSDFRSTSFAKGLPFQNTRVSGTTASLAGLEKAVNQNDQAGIKKSVDRIILLHSVILSIGGIPMLYLGDEVATLNNYSYRKDPEKAYDSRWVHRSKKNWFSDNMALANKFSYTNKVYTTISKMIEIRKRLALLSGNEVKIVFSEQIPIFGYVRQNEDQLFLAVVNFTPLESTITSVQFSVSKLSGCYSDLLNGGEINTGNGFTIKPYQFHWLLHKKS